MSGTIELFVDADEKLKFRLVGPDGGIVAMSGSFGSKPAAVEGISMLREYAGMSLVTDLSCPGQRRGSSRLAATA